MCVCLITKYTNNIFLLPHSLKLECEKLASDKTEMQRHYVMVSLTDYVCVCVRMCVCVCAHALMCEQFFGVCKKRGKEKKLFLTLLWLSFFFPVLRNVIRAEHRDAQTGRKRSFARTLKRSRTDSDDTVVGVRGTRVLETAADHQRRYHVIASKDQTAVSWWKSSNLKSKNVRFQIIIIFFHSSGPQILLIFLLKWHFVILKKETQSQNLIFTIIIKNHYYWHLLIFLCII